MANITNAVLLIVNTNSYRVPSRITPLGTTLVSNLIYFSSNTKAIVTTTQYTTGVLNLKFVSNAIYSNTGYSNSYSTKGTTLVPNLAYFSSNTKAIVTTKTFSANNNPVRYYTANDATFKYVPKGITLVPNLAYFSSNTKAIVTATTFSANNNPVRYYTANDATFKYVPKGITLVPNLAYFSSNTKAIVTTTQYITGVLNLKFVSNVIYSNTGYSYSTRGTGISVSYTSTSPRQFWT